MINTHAEEVLPMFPRFVQFSRLKQAIFGSAKVIYYAVVAFIIGAYVIHSLFSDGNDSNPHLTRKLESVAGIKGGIENELEQHAIHVHTPQEEVKQETQKVQEVASLDSHMEVQKVPMLY